MFPIKKTKAESVAPPRFLDPKKDGPSRVKHLKLALDASGSVHDRRQVLDVYSFEIFHLFHELLTTAEVSIPAAGNRYSGAELECALWLLEQFLTYLPDKIAQKWQFNAIGNALKQCLHPQNGIPLRKIALRLFLLWYQALGAENPGMAASLDAIFAVLVPNLPLPSGASSLKLLEELCSDFGSATPPLPVPVHQTSSSQGWLFFRNKALAPPISDKTAPQTPAVLLQMFMEKLLECIAKDCTRLEWYSQKKEAMQRRGLKFLLTKLRKYYIDLCWPDLAKNGVSLLSESSSGLPSDPVSPGRPLLGIREPWIVCRFCIVRWVSTYTFSHRNVNDSLNDGSPEKTPGAKYPSSFEQIRDALLGDMDSTCLTLSILREGLLLPFQCHAVMNRVIKTLREWIFQQVVPPFMSGTFHGVEDGSQIGIRTLVHILCWFYYNPYLVGDKPDLRIVMPMSNKILGTLKDLASPQRPPIIALTLESWYELLRCLLRVVNAVIPPNPSTTTEDVDFPRALALHLFQTLLITWVLASAVCKLPLPPELWNSLTETLSQRTAWPQLIEEWNKVLETTTRALSLNFFQIDLMNAPLDRATGRRQIKEAGESRSKLGTDSPSVSSSARTSDSVLSPRELYNICQPAVDSEAVAAKFRPAGDKREATKQRSSSDLDRPKSSIVQSMELGTAKNKENTNGSIIGAVTPSQESSDGVSMESASVSSAEFGILEEKEMGDKTSLFDRESLTPSPGVGDGSLEDLSEAMLEEDVTDLTPRDENLPGELASDGGLAWVIAWRRIVGCLGNISRITDPDLRLKAVEALGKMTATLIRIRDNMGISLDGQSTPEQPKFVPPLHYAVPFLLEVLVDDAPPFRESQLESFRILSTIFLRKASGIPIPERWAVQYYERALSMLKDGGDREKQVVLATVSPCFFTLDLPGLQILLSDSMQASLGILSSFPAEAIGFSTVLASYPLDAKAAEAIRNTQMDAINLLSTAVVDSGKLKWKTLSMALNGITLFVYHQLREPKQHPSFQPAIDALVKNFQNSSDQIALQVCESIALLLQQIFSATSSNLDELGERLMDILGYEFHRRLSAVGKGLSERILCCMMDICVKRHCTGSHSQFVSSLGEVLSGTVKGSLQSCSRTAVDHLITWKNQYPLPKFSVAQFGSKEMDLEDPKVSISVSQSGQTLSVAPAGEHVMLSTRTIGAKHNWALSQMYKATDGKEDSNKINDWLLSGSQEAESVAKDKNSSSSESKDAFGNFLSNLLQSSPECQSGNPEPIQLPYQHEIELGLHNLSLHRCKPIPPALPQSKGPNEPKVDAMSVWRNLTSDLSMIVWEKQSIYTQLREDPEKLNRELKHLDNLQSRETFKIAVLYVAHGQEDKTSILNNTQGSVMFEKFVGGLGWEVDLKSHLGYMGGLPPVGTAPYYADLNTQLLFHVSTRLSHLDSTKKTKHLGNDEVHIVWSEHLRDYRRAIFPTEFCDILLVIYPLKTPNLFRIHLECRDEDSMIGLGPLFNGATVCWASLAPLVRATAINASRMKRRSVTGWEPPWEQRSKALQNIRDQMSKPSSFSDLLGVMFGGGKAKETVLPKLPPPRIRKVWDESAEVAV